MDEEDDGRATEAWSFLRRWFGPLGRYRPGLLRMDMARGFRRCGLSLPGWLPRWISPEDRLLEGLELTGRVVYDIGAHTGDYTLFFSRRVGAGGRVVAFEPRRSSFERLKLAMLLNRIANVKALELALGAVAGTHPLYMIPGMGTTASLAREARTPLRVRVGTARVERLDDVIAQHGLPAPDFIKIDVEGLELDVLQGAAGTLERWRPEVLVEIHGASHGDKLERVRTVARMLNPLGYGLTHAESGRRVSHETRGIGAGHLYAQQMVSA